MENFASFRSSQKPRFVMKDDPYADQNEACVEFKLTYDGLLLGSNGSSSRGQHKHDIRRKLHPQLKRLWELNPHLNHGNSSLPQGEIRISYPPAAGGVSVIDVYAHRFGCGDYRLVPLVIEDLELLCELDILWLRPDKPGAIIRSGDIDNRLKTLLDALRMPQNKAEIQGHEKPLQDEDPFYCLLEDDKLITSLSVGTDVLLQSVREDGAIGDNDVRLVITVKLRPTRAKRGSLDYM